MAKKQAKKPAKKAGGVRRPKRKPAPPEPTTTTRTVRPGRGPVVFTIGYEQRTPLDLVEALQREGVGYLADTRERPTSRRPEFRKGPLVRFLAAHGVEYGPWPELGTPPEQREFVRRTKDYETFRREFREYADEHMPEDVDRLATVVRTRPVALLCYERKHGECHRSVIAEMLAERLDAKIVAIE
jgi:uncharacterized protein (DUF488 family)